MITDTEKMIGFVVVVISGVVLATIVLTWQRNKKYITVYRPYEERLLNQNKLLLEHYMEYISKYNFGNYAALSMGMILIAISLILFESDRFVGFDIYVMTIILFGLASATICFVYADLVHTNTQTPIIPIKQRFELVDLSIGLFQVGLYLILFSIIFYISLINLNATIISSGALLVILLVVQKKRAIKKERFFEYFNVFEEDKGGWEEYDGEYIDNWQKEQTEKFRFDLKIGLKQHLKEGPVNEVLRNNFKNKKYPLSEDSKITQEDENYWKINDGGKEYRIKHVGKKLKIYQKMGTEEIKKECDVSYELDQTKYQKYEEILMTLGEENIMNEDKMDEIEEKLKEFRDPLQISRKDQDIILVRIRRGINEYEDLIKKIHLEWGEKQSEFIKFKEMAEKLRESLGISKEYHNTIEQRLQAKIK